MIFWLNQTDQGYEYIFMVCIALVFKASVLTLRVYVFECWTLITEFETNLNNFALNCYRVMLNVTRSRTTYQKKKTAQVCRALPLQKQNRTHQQIRTKRTKGRRKRRKPQTAYRMTTHYPQQT
jgi:hypothetical protein